MRETAKLAVALMAFALVAALLLAVVNEFTEDKIAQNTADKVNSARRAVIGDCAFEDAGADLTGYTYIKGVYCATRDNVLEGYVYELESRGYGGTVYISAGISASGELTGVMVSSHSETKGLGGADEDGFMRQFVGLTTDDEALAVDAMSGATISSNAVKNAVAEALAHYADNYAEERNAK